MGVEKLLWQGQVIQAEEPELILNRAFRFGDGVFETIRIISGKPFLWDIHMHRLRAGMKQLKLGFDEAFFSKLESEAQQIIHANSIDQGGILRIWVYRGGKGKYTPTDNTAERLMTAEVLDFNNFQLNLNGLKVDLANDNVIIPHKLSPYKTINALPYVMAAIEKEERGLDDLMLLNHQGNVVEATSSNIFLLHGEKLITPPIEDGAVAGVMRAHIMDFSDNFEIELIERSITEQDLNIADEIFLSNSISGIQWVGAFRKKRYFNSFAKKILAALH